MQTCKFLIIFVLVFGFLSTPTYGDYSITNPKKTRIIINPNSGTASKKNIDTKGAGATKAKGAGAAICDSLWIEKSDFGIIFI